MIPACLYGAFIPRPTTAQKPLPEGLCSTRTGAQYGTFERSRSSDGSVVSTVGVLPYPIRGGASQRTAHLHLLDFQRGIYTFREEIYMPYGRQNVWFCLVESTETHKQFFVKTTLTKNPYEGTLQQEAARLSEAVVGVENCIVKEMPRGVFKTTLVYPYIEDGDLFDLLHIRPLPTEEIAQKFRPLVHALVLMHENRITHRDIKPENILIDAEDRFRLTDFGLSKQLPEEEHYTGTPVGTVTYLDPCIDGRSSYDPKKADVWSLGCTLYSCHTQKDIKSRTLPTTSIGIKRCLSAIEDPVFLDLL
jgi:serine/threonine protein kinase